MPLFSSKGKEGTRLNTEWGLVQMDLTGFYGDPYSSFSNYIPLIITLGWLRGGTIGPYVEDMETPKGQSVESSWVPWRPPDFKSFGATPVLILFCVSCGSCQVSTGHAVIRDEASGLVPGIMYGGEMCIDGTCRLLERLLHVSEFWLDDILGLTLAELVPADCKHSISTWMLKSSEIISLGVSNATTAHLHQN